jgi:hypothetical protein
LDFKETPFLSPLKETPSTFGVSGNRYLTFDQGYENINKLKLNEKTTSLCLWNEFWKRTSKISRYLISKNKIHFM